MLSWSHEMKSEEVAVSIPKFSIEKGFEAIHSINLPRLSDPEQADFSGATTTKHVALTHLFHHTLVEIDEDGEEEEEAPFFPKTKDLLEPVRFEADHPFFFYILEKIFGLPIAMGRISKPV